MLTRDAFTSLSSNYVLAEEEPDFYYAEHISEIPSSSREVGILPCHMSLRGDIVPGDMGFDPTNPEVWCLNRFQSIEEVPQIIEDHIKSAVLWTSKTPSRILSITGTSTNIAAGKRTEADSYFQVCDYYNWWGHPEVRKRTILEQRALDTRMNIGYSLLRFQEYHPLNVLPWEVNVFGWKFKEERCRAVAGGLGVPRFIPRGLTNPANFVMDEAAQQREAELVEAYRRDPFGLNEPEKVVRKIQERNVRQLPPPNYRLWEIPQMYAQLYAPAR